MIHSPRRYTVAGHAAALAPVLAIELSCAVSTAAARSLLLMMVVVVMVLLLVWR